MPADSHYGVPHTAMAGHHTTATRQHTGSLGQVRTTDTSQAMRQTQHMSRHNTRQSRATHNMHMHHPSACMPYMARLYYIT